MKTKYYYDGWRVLTETNGSGARQRHYVYGNYLDEALMLIHDDGHETNPAYTDYYYACDHLYSPAALLDDDGDVVERYEYDAYGTCHVMEDDYDPRASSIYNNPIAFTGQRLDRLDNGDLLLMYYKNRHYCPTIGRFLQRDPMGVLDAISIFDFNRLSGNPSLLSESIKVKLQYSDGLNIYNYAVLRPTVQTDPIGRISIFSWPEIIAPSCSPFDVYQYLKSLADYGDWEQISYDIENYWHNYPKSSGAMYPCPCHSTKDGRWPAPYISWTYLGSCIDIDISFVKPSWLETQIYSPLKNKVVKTYTYKLYQHNMMTCQRNCLKKHRLRSSLCDCKTPEERIALENTINKIPDWEIVSTILDIKKILAQTTTTVYRRVKRPPPNNEV